MIKNVDIETGPYLQYCNDSSIYVLAVTKIRKDLSVQYWNSNDTNTASTLFVKNLKTSNSNHFVHRILLKNLKPGEKYSYRIENSNDKSIFEFYFHDASKEKFKFIAIGDPQGDTAVFSALLENIREKEVSFILFLGDICHSPHYDDFKKEFFISENLKVISEIPFFNTCGNHERWGRSTKALLQAPVETGESIPYYSFNYGQAHFVIMNSEIDPGSFDSQHEFLVEDLTNNYQKWTILVFHKPVYVYGGTGPDLNLREIITQLVENYDIDLVLNGHSHFFQHNYVDGVHYMISGGGGGPDHIPEKGKETLYSSVDHHLLEIEITSDSIEISAINTDDSVIYNYSITK